MMTDEQLIWAAEEDFFALTVEEFRRLIALAKEGVGMKRRLQTLEIERDYLAAVNSHYVREVAAANFAKNNPLTSVTL